MNYLITGGAGFIGYALAKKLAKNKNDKIYILDLKNKNKILKKKNKKNNLIFVDADIRIKKFFCQMSVHWNSLSNQSSK